MAIFKYFTEEAHAQAFIRKGAMLLRPLAYFRALESEEGGRGDRRDGILTYAPPEGLVLNMQDGRTITLPGGSFNSSVQQNDIYVFCASNQLSSELAKSFGPHCVEIADPDELVARFKLRACPTSRLDYTQIICGPVNYRPHDQAPEADWALPERLVLIKPGAFAWQDEFRIAVGNRGTFDVENVRLTIQTGGDAAGGKAPLQSHIAFSIGDLSAFTKLHSL